MENQFLSQVNIELLEVSSVCKNNLENSKFSLLNNYVFYFNCNLEKKEIDFYIENNFEKLDESFKAINKTLIIVNSQNIKNTEIQSLKYYFPTLKLSSEYFNTSQSLLDYFNYSGTINTGLVTCNNRLNYKKEISIIEINNSFYSTDLDLFFDDYFKHLKYNNGFVFEPIPIEYELYSPIYYEPDEIEFNDEDKEEIQLIIDKLNEIKNKGNFIALLPILENHLQNQNLNNTKLSRIYIDQDYKIWLTDYNLEVKLSHLTKTIYFLFLAMEHKIHLSDLSKYKKYLINIYLSISNQENLDKMLQSIDLLINDKNAIYVHLSRIKATFHKLIFKDIAEKYCIQGAKEEPKSILLPKNLTNIDSFLQQWEINPKIYVNLKKTDDNLDYPI